MKSLVKYLTEGLKVKKQQAPNVDPELKNVIRFGMRRGYIMGSDKVKYGISADNLFAIPVGDDLTVDQLKTIVQELTDNEGIQFKYKTSDEWKKAGYEDPLEDAPEPKTHKSAPNVAPDIKNVIRFGMKRGYIVGPDKLKYGISADNLFAIPLGDDLTVDQLKAIVQELTDKEGIKFKYQTSDEWKKERYKDPLAD